MRVQGLRDLRLSWSRSSGFRGSGRLNSNVPQSNAQMFGWLYCGAELQCSAASSSRHAPNVLPCFLSCLQAAPGEKLATAFAGRDVEQREILGHWAAVQKMEKGVSVSSPSDELDLFARVFRLLRVLSRSHVGLGGGWTSSPFQTAFLCLIPDALPSRHEDSQPASLSARSPLPHVVMQTVSFAQVLAIGIQVRHVAVSLCVCVCVRPSFSLSLSRPLPLLALPRLSIHIYTDLYAHSIPKFEIWMCPVFHIGPCYDVIPVWAGSLALWAPVLSTAFLGTLLGDVVLD